MQKKGQISKCHYIKFLQTHIFAGNEQQYADNQHF